MNEELGFNPESIGTINVAALSIIAAKQDAIMHMLSFLIAETTETKETAESVFSRYKASAMKQAQIISEGMKQI